MTQTLRTLRIALAAALLPSLASIAAAQSTDPRVGLRAGWGNAAEAAFNLKLIGHVDRPAGFVDSTSIGNFGVINSDLAFRANQVFQGNFNGWQVWDITTPASPKLRKTFVCPGGQGDLPLQLASLADGHRRRNWR